MARVTGKYLSQLEWKDIRDLKLKEARPLLKKARQALESRAKSLEKSGVYSQALENVKTALKDTKAVSRTKLGEAQKEIYRISKFFGEKGSTIAGARKIATQQDIAIFGANESGRPIHRMKPAQRARFWSIYNEYLETYKTAEAIYGSNKIQQFLGDAIWNNRKNPNFDVNADTLESINLKLYNIEEQISRTKEAQSDLNSHWERVVPNANIYSGNWNPWEE